MVSCVCCGCTRTPTVKSSGITFHTLPADEVRRRKWIDFVKIHIKQMEDWKYSKNHRLCSQHFTDECFDRSSIIIVRLRETAIPTIEIHRQKYVVKDNEPIKVIQTSVIPAPYASTLSPISTTFDLERKQKLACIENVMQEERIRTQQRTVLKQNT